MVISTAGPDAGGKGRSRATSPKSLGVSVSGDSQKPDDFGDPCGRSGRLGHSDAHRKANDPDPDPPSHHDRDIPQADIPADPFDRREPTRASRRCHQRPQPCAANCEQRSAVTITASELRHQGTLAGRPLRRAPGSRQLRRRDTRYECRDPDNETSSAPRHRRASAIQAACSPAEPNDLPGGRAGYRLAAGSRWRTAAMTAIRGMTAATPKMTNAERTLVAVATMPARSPPIGMPP